MAVYQVMEQQYLSWHTGLPLYVSVKNCRHMCMGAHIINSPVFSAWHAQCAPRYVDASGKWRRKVSYQGCSFLMRN